MEDTTKEEIMEDGIFEGQEEITDIRDSRILLIDADTIAFIACLNNQIEHMDICDLNAAYAEVDMKIDYIKSATTLRNVELHLTGGRESFRYALYSGYKAKRELATIPKGLAEVKNYMEKQYGATIHTNIEADDYVVYAKTANPDKYLLVAIDKDVLYSCVGTHYNYHFSKSGEMTVDSTTAYNWSLYQTVMGDSTDNIKGVKGYGEVKATKFIESLKEDLIMDKLGKILGLYKGDEQEMVLNYNLVSCHLYDGEKVNLVNSLEQIVESEIKKIHRLDKGMLIW